MHTFTLYSPPVPFANYSQGDTNNQRNSCHHSHFTGVNKGWRVWGGCGGGLRVWVAWSHDDFHFSQRLFSSRRRARLQVSVRGSQQQPDRDVWDSCCLSRGFQSVRICCYTFNTPSVRLLQPTQGDSVSTHSHTSDQYRLWRWHRDAPREAIGGGCFFFFFCSNLSFFPSLFSGLLLKRSIVKHHLTSTCLRHHILSLSPRETIGRCNI